MFQMFFFFAIPGILLTTNRAKEKVKANKKSLSCYYLLWVIAFSIPPPSEAFTVSFCLPMFLLICSSAG